MKTLFLNSVVLSGRLAADPQIFMFESGDTKVAGRIAYPDGYYSKKEGRWVERPLWINFESLVPKVVKAMAYAQKGDIVTLQGKLRTERYTRKDGIEIEKAYIYVSNFTVARKINMRPEQETTPEEAIEEIKANPPEDDFFEEEGNDDVLF